MTQREKDWVIKIQMMQLNNTGGGGGGGGGGGLMERLGNYHDFYYQAYFEKLERRLWARSVDSEHDHREPLRLNTPQLARVEHTYTPVQFEGSLGKLTVSSVNNPRRMIDAVATATRPSDDEDLKEKQGRDKRRHVLHTIENAYSLLLSIEDVDRVIAKLAGGCRGDGGPGDGNRDDRTVAMETRQAKLQALMELLQVHAAAATDAGDER
ncbi:protein PAT1 homolog 1-like [Lethenteron reissneri]|uniref:protein PAT1 homolog 1-like n=1 Tax=Lethenteron reissneri TaxID=7753 RepID=UPI002AB6D42D|nr:protein PAT1 homolog 1-like [Lethenteron reissneri]